MSRVLIDGYDADALLGSRGQALAWVTLSAAELTPHLSFSGDPLEVGERINARAAELAEVLGSAMPDVPVCDV